MKRTLVAALALLAALTACAAPPKTVTFVGQSDPMGTSITVTVDVIPAAGSTTGGTTYPHEWVTLAPFTHIHAAQPGTVVHLSITVTATEPGQIVGCVILLDGVTVDSGAGRYGKPAICIGPPV